MGFSQKALDDYEPRVLYYAEKLATALLASEGLPLDATAWCSFFGFDAMSELAFGEPMDMIRDGKSHYVRDLLTAGLSELGRLTPVPCLFHLAGSLLGVTKDWQAYRGWVFTQLRERMQRKAEQSNVMS